MKKNIQCPNSPIENSVYAANDFPYTINLKTITNIKPN